MYEEITDTKPCIDAIEYEFGTSHAEQAAHLYEENGDLDNYNDIAVREIIDYLHDYWFGDSDAEFIKSFGIFVLIRLDTEGGEQ